VRPGCLFEESSSIAHSVGVKQTVFLPWVTAGSLVNFCDCLMAGGTGRRNHSEIGSSYVHFNFTPRQDKATASLIGDVPRGVLLDQPPIFLGGQGGLVGPCAIEFGTVIPAGQIWRGDVTQPGRLVAKPAARAAIDRPFNPSHYRGVRRILRANLVYIGNILALDTWYRAVRARFMHAAPFSAACHTGARLRLAEILEERLVRLDELAAKVERALAPGRADTTADERAEFVDGWPARKAALARLIAGRDRMPVPADIRELFERLPPRDYLATIQTLDPERARRITAWLEQTVTQALAPPPAFT
jgi:UDP-N-acetylglucosamine/UDP-N-acetylgalactosamine diphosphorylase